MSSVWTLWHSRAYCTFERKNEIRMVVHKLGNASKLVSQTSLLVSPDTHGVYFVLGQFIDLWITFKFKKKNDENGDAFKLTSLCKSFISQNQSEYGLPIKPVARRHQTVTLIARFWKCAKFLTWCHKRPEVLNVMVQNEIEFETQVQQILSSDNHGESTRLYPNPPRRWRKLSWKPQDEAHKLVSRIPANL